MDTLQGLQSQPRSGDNPTSSRREARRSKEWGYLLRPS